MASTFTTNANFEKIADGEQENTWGATERSNQDKLDDIVRGYLAKSVAGSSNVTLTEAEWNHRSIKCTGALTGNIELQFPDVQGTWEVWNATTGDFTLTMSTVSGSGVEMPRDARGLVTSDGTDCFILLQSLIADADGYVTKSVAGSSNVTLTYTEYVNKIIQVTGILTGDIDLIFPATEKGYWFENQTTGDFDITVKVTGQNGFIAPQGYGFLTYSDASDMIVMGPPMAHGSVQLAKSGANLALTAYDGPGGLIINGRMWFLPNGGITLAPTGLSTSTLHYIYAYVSSGALTLEASTTAPTAANNGLQIKTGDASRTLVGMAYVITGPAFADSATQRLVRSWFNRRGATGVDTATDTTKSTTISDLDSGLRVEFVAWADDIARARGNLAVDVSLAAAAPESQASFDNTDHGGIIGGFNVTAGLGMNMSCEHVTNLSVGYHFANIRAGRSSGSGTTTFENIELQVQLG